MKEKQMKEKFKTQLVKLVIILAASLLAVFACSSMAAADSMPNEVLSISYSSKTVKKTKLYKTTAKKKVIATIPKGAKVTVINSRLKNNSLYKVKYKSKTGYVLAAHLLDNDHPAEKLGDQSAYDYNVTDSPDFYARANTTVSVFLYPKSGSSVLGKIYNGAVVGVYGQSGSYYDVSYRGERSYVPASGFTRATPNGKAMIVNPTNGGRIRVRPYISSSNQRSGAFDTLPYKSKVTVLSSSIESDDFTWYRVLWRYNNKYYVEGYMREDVLSSSESSSSESSEGGTNRVIDTGTSDNSVVRDAPNGKRITSLPNYTVVYATGEIKKAGGRNWARITSPIKGWVAANHVGFAKK